MSAKNQVTSLALAVLELLHGGPKHPYEIHQTMRERRQDRLLKLTPGTLYHAVERLARDGLTEVVETTREGNRPERTTYRITDRGRDVFADRLRCLVAEPADDYPAYSIGIAFLHRLDLAQAKGVLRSRTMALESKIASLDVFIQRVGESGTHPMFWMDMPLHRHMIEAELTWTRKLLDDLERGRINWPDHAEPAQVRALHSVDDPDVRERSG